MTAILLESEEQARAWLAAEFSPSARQWQRLESYAALLAAANIEQNLVAAGTLPQLWVRHIADSAQLIRFDARGGGLWLDLGSGAGLPGLIVAILTDRPVMMVESRNLRHRFLTETADALGIASQTRVVADRIERVDAVASATISARAFAPLPRLIDLSARFSTPTTLWLLPKGRNAAKELASLPPAWHKLFHVEQSLTDHDSGILVGMGTVANQRGRR